MNARMNQWFALLLVVLLCATAQAQEKLQKVTFASCGHFVNYLPLDLAIAMDFFEDEGLQPELIVLRGGTLTAQALISKQVDFSVNSIAHALKAADKGNSNLRMVCLFNETPGVLLVVDSKHKDKVKAVADLKGMKLGVTSLGSATHMILAYLLERNAVSLNDVEIVKAGSSTFPSALKNGNINAGIAGEPIASMMVEKGDAYVLVRLVSAQETQDTFGGPYNLLGLLTRQDLIDSNPELIQKVVNVHARSLEWLDGHSAEEIAAVLPTEVVGSDRGAFTKTLKLMKAFFSVDGSMSVEGAENVLLSMKLSGVFDFTKFFQVQNFLEDRFLVAVADFQPVSNQTSKPSGAPQESKSGRIWIYIFLAIALVVAVFVIVARRCRKNG